MTDALNAAGQTCVDFGHWLFFGQVTVQPWAIVVIVMFAFWLAFARADDDSDTRR